MLNFRSLISKFATMGNNASITKGNTTMTLGNTGFLKICLNSFSTRYFNIGYSSLSLNVFNVITINKTVIETNTTSSGTIADKPSPFIIRLLAAVIYHLAGTTKDNALKYHGMFSTGNIIPDSKITGNIRTIPDI